MKKRLFVPFPPLFFLCLLVNFPILAQPEEKPNILFILVDDLGYHDLGITGSQFYETPAIDGLAKKSFQFSQGYSASPVCSPARASIMTGLTPANHGITEWIGAKYAEGWRENGRHTILMPPQYQHALDHAYLTLPEALKLEGYETFFAGKWHLGRDGSHPEDHGFDTNVGGYHSGSPLGGYFAPYDNPKLQQGPDGENLSLRLAEETIEFISGEHEKPFFAFLSFYAVHSPIQTTESRWEKYRDKAEKTGLADAGFIMERRLPIRQVQDNPVYAGLVETMDEAVGNVLAALEESGLDDDTIIIFTSDNGGVSSGDNFSTSNLPLRGGKGYQWEGGLRVPFFIKVPGMENPQVVDYPASGTDFYATILDLIGAKQRPGVHQESLSLLPAMKGKKMKERAMFWHYPHYSNQGGDPFSAIRKGDWKLIYYWENDITALYNLKKDPFEQKDLAAEHPAIVQGLEKELDQWLAQTNANRPTPDPTYHADLEKAYLEKVRTTVWSNLESQRKQMLQPNWKPNQDWWGSKVTVD